MSLMFVNSPILLFTIVFENIQSAAIIKNTLGFNLIYLLRHWMVYEN